MNFLNVTPPLPPHTWLGNILEHVFYNSQGGTHIVAWLFYILFFMIVIDIITGWMKGIYNGNLDSSRNHRGYVRKLVLIIVASMTIAMDFIAQTMLFYLGMGDFTVMGFILAEVPLVSIIVLSWLLLGEVLSILENMGAVGVRFPRFIEKALNRLSKQIDEGEVNIQSVLKQDKEGNTVIENTMTLPVETKRKKEDGQ